VTDFAGLLAHVVEVGGSDLHVSADSPPRIRVNGDLKPAPFSVITADELQSALPALLPPDRLEEFNRTGDADFSFSIDNVGRFRGNVSRQRGTPTVVLRRVLPSAVSVVELGLPPVVTRLAEEQRGMVLVTGPTGSGKTTTLAAMVDHINTTRGVKVVTLEDPIEVLHANKRSMVCQREIGTDTENYAQGMRRVLRQDPDVILIGEMRDPETVAAALGAAETGHLVLSTLHTTNATETINRVIDFFPPHQQHQTRLTLASVLRGVISQRLVPHASDKGRVAAIEVMVVSGRIADRIVNPDATGDTIAEQIADGEYQGMQTFDQSLFGLLKAGQVNLRSALAAATNPHDFRVAIESAGLIPSAR
jgi:twitching motility protein PilT